MIPPATGGTGSRTLLDRLRNETREDHQRLEESIDLLRPDLTRTAYAQIVGRFYGFYVPWESNVAAFAARIVPDFATRRQKVAHLVADLTYLGVDCRTLPLCIALLPCDSVWTALGGLYVTEGATLGGQLISRHLRRTILDQAQGDAFFQSYGDRVGAMWSSFRQTLEGYSSTCADDRIVDAAKLMFQTLHNWIDQPCVNRAI